MSFQEEQSLQGLRDSEGGLVRKGVSPAGTFVVVRQQNGWIRRFIVDADDFPESDRAEAELMSELRF